MATEVRAAVAMPAPGLLYARRRQALGVLIFCLSAITLDTTIVNVALPSIQQALHTTQGGEEWVVDAYSLTFASLLLACGLMGDRHGRRRLMAIGMGVFGAASVLASVSPTEGWLIVARGLMGVGAAAVLPATLAIITDVFPVAERARAIAAWAACSGIAVALGPVVGGVLVHAFGWGSIFLVNVPIVILGCVGLFLVVPESRDPRFRPVDWTGVGLSMVGLFALVYGIILGSQRGQWGGVDVWGVGLAGVALLVLFVFEQRRSPAPVMDYALFRRPAFGVAGVALALNFYVLFSGLFVITYFLQFVRGYSPPAAGALLMPVAVALLLFSSPAVLLAQRRGTKVACTAGLLLVSAACVGSLVIGTSTPIWMVEALLFVEGIGMASVFAPATSSMMLTVPTAQAGVGSAANNALRQLGGALGLAVTGSVLSLLYRSRIESALPGWLVGPHRQAASESIGGAIGQIKVAHLQGTHQGHLFAVQADHAFVGATHLAFLSLAAVALVGAAITARWLPGRSGQASGLTPVAK